MLSIIGLLLFFNVITYINGQFHECIGKDSNCHTINGTRRCDPGWLIACPTPLTADCHLNCTEYNVSLSKFVLVNERKTFNNAVIGCNNRGLVLASIHNSTEAWEVTAVCRVQPLVCWIGLKRDVNETEFKWIDDSNNTDYSFPWFGPNPDLPLNQAACVMVGHQGGWSDFTCFYQQPFICGPKPPTQSPTTDPTQSPTRRTYGPTPTPTDDPSPSPTTTPTTSPTSSPTDPTRGPTPAPTDNPTPSPTGNPTNGPTSSPTPSPTATPTDIPTPSPTDNPTMSPTFNPTASPICGDNTNSGPGQQIECKSDDECCIGFSCRTKEGPKKGKCGRDKTKKKSMGYMDLLKFDQYSNNEDNTSYHEFMEIGMVFVVLINVCNLVICCCCIGIKRKRNIYHNIIEHASDLDDI